MCEMGMLYPQQFIHFHFHVTRRNHWQTWHYALQQWYGK